MSDYEYRTAQVLSVKGGNAYVALDGDSKSTKVYINEYVELQDGEYSKDGCDWDDTDTTETDVDDTTPDGATTVTLKRNKGKDGKGKGQWSVHKVHSKPTHVLKYTIGNPQSPKPVTNHHHERIIILWTYVSANEADWDGGADFKYAVRVDGNTIVSQTLGSGVKVSKKKRANSKKAIAPSQGIRVVVTDGGDLSGPALITIGYRTA